MAGKKDAKIASERPRAEVGDTRHACAHCGQTIRTNNLLAVRRIAFSGTKAASRQVYYIKGHETMA